MWYIGESAVADWFWQSGVLSKSSWLESPGLAGAPDREDLSIVRFQLLSMRWGWNLPVWRPRPGRFVNCAFSALIYEVGLESPGLGRQTGRFQPPALR